MNDETPLTPNKVNEAKVIYRLAIDYVETNQRLDSAMKRRTVLILKEALTILALFEIDAVVRDDFFAMMNTRFDASASQPREENPPC